MGQGNIEEAETLDREENTYDSALRKFDEVGDWASVERYMQFQASYSSQKSKFDSATIIFVVRELVKCTSYADIRISLGNPTLTSDNFRGCKKTTIRAIETLYADDPEFLAQLGLSSRNRKKDRDILARYTYFPRLIGLIHEDSSIRELFNRNPHYAMLITALTEGKSVVQIAAQYFLVHALNLHSLSSDILARFTRGESHKNNEILHIGRRFTRAMLFRSYMCEELGSAPLVPLYRRTAILNREVISHLNLIMDHQIVFSDEHTSFGKNLGKLISCLPIFESALSKYSAVAEPYQVKPSEFLLLFSERGRYSGSLPTTFRQIIETSARGEDLTLLADKIALTTQYSQLTVLTYLEAGLRYLENVFLLPYESEKTPIHVKLGRARSIEISQIAAYLTSKIASMVTIPKDEIEI